VDARSGRIYGADIQRARVGIDNFDRAYLDIAGRVDGPGNDMLRMLRETPLKRITGPYVKGLEAEGDNQVELDIRISLTSGDDSVKVSGDVLFDGRSALALPEWDIRLDELNGRVAFGGDGLQAKDLQAHFRGAPARLDIATDQASGITAIETRASLPPAALFSPGENPLEGLLAGSAPLTLSLAVPPRQPGQQQSPPIDLELNSQLRGIAVALPAPLGKTAETPGRLRLRSRILDDGFAPITVSYGDHARLHLELGKGGDGPELARGLVFLGDGELPPPPAQGLHVDGRLPWLDLELLLGSDRVAITEALISSRSAALGVSPRLLRYRLRSPVLLFNQDNYPRYQALDEAGQQAERDRLLIAQLLTALRGLGVEFPQQLYATFTAARARKVNYKQQALLGFGGEIVCNAALPAGFAIGHAVSHGFGWLQPPGEAGAWN